MFPTLREWDLLDVRPVGTDSIRIGDVVVFPSPENGQLIIHRVVSLTPQGIRTRGDYNYAPDDWLLRPEHIIGRVTAAWFGQRRRRIDGGWRGRCTAVFVTWRKRMVQQGSVFWRKIMSVLNFPKILGIVFPWRYHPRPGLFQMNGRPCLRLLVGQRLIGWYVPEQRQWHVRWPYRLWVNTQHLPSLPQDPS